jgi:hypothetical protein
LQSRPHCTQQHVAALYTVSSSCSPFLSQSNMSPLSCPSPNTVVGIACYLTPSCCLTCLLPDSFLHIRWCRQCSCPV